MTRLFLILESNHPSVLNTQKDLIIANAETLSGALQMSNQGITNLDGLQYFKSITRYTYQVTN